MRELLFWLTYLCFPAAASSRVAIAIYEWRITATSNTVTNGPFASICRANNIPCISTTWLAQRCLSSPRSIAGAAISSSVPSWCRPAATGYDWRRPTGDRVAGHPAAVCRSTADVTATATAAERPKCLPRIAIGSGYLV
jgi:hypothetical protein